MQQKSAPVYIEVVLPLALNRLYTYVVPPEWIPSVKIGVRVEVQFGKSKLYTAIVKNFCREAPTGYPAKEILSVVDDTPLVSEEHLAFWEWVSAYYCCTMGEVMQAALPSHLKLTSETVLVLHPDFEADMLDPGLEDKAYLLAEALTIQGEIKLDDVQGIIGNKTVYPVIKSLLGKNILLLKEDLKEKFQPRKVDCLRLREPFRSQPDRLDEAFESIARSQRQVTFLMAYIQLSRGGVEVRKQDVYKMSNGDSSVLQRLVKKEILEVYSKEISRLGSGEEETMEADTLSDQQTRALTEVMAHFEDKQCVLLEGVTGSGKTRLYIELIARQLDQGQQVLYLLPEIALTTQIVERLRRIFGDQVQVYHSRLNDHERVEVWNKVLEGKGLILGARSALFLPFQQLGLVVVDEEHDYSFKQAEPNPRYQGRDSAIYLAAMFGAKVLLGSATPSLESWYNAEKGKYGKVEMRERFGGILMPEIVLADLRDARKRKEMHGNFSGKLISLMEETLERGEQVILFQNRRGYAPSYHCDVCDWHAVCIRCDVSLTYHKGINLMKCHYCGYQSKLPESCPGCGNRQLKLRGFGTEKIEDDLKVLFPNYQAARMDLETVRGKHSHAKIIHSFEEGSVQILVGTQMVTKGLDFDRVGLVGVLYADQLWQFPDFRASERSLQLLLQVSGRAGRKKEGAKVLIQTSNISHPIIGDIMRMDIQGFYRRELEERKDFAYPPYTRLIHILVRHKQSDKAHAAMLMFSKWLIADLGERVIGPSVPYTALLRGYYQQQVLIKFGPGNAFLKTAKMRITDLAEQLKATPGLSGVRVVIDVDPY